MKRVPTVMRSCLVVIVIYSTHLIKDTNCQRLPANKNLTVGKISYGWDSNHLSLHNGGSQFDHLKPAKVFTPSNFRSKRSLLTCDVTSNTCQQTASLQSDTEVWKNVCYMDSSNKAHACSEICLQSQPGYDDIDCHFRYCKNFLRTCPEEQEAVSWVNRLHCDVSNVMCQEGGLPHTEYFNISCYKHDVGEHYGSCSEICNSDKFTHKQKCDAYCSSYKENCLNKKKVTSRKPPVTSHKESPTAPHPKNPADITNDQQINRKTAIGGSVGVFVFIAILVVLSLCLWRKGWCRRKVAGAGRVLQRQASGTVTAAGSVVKAAGAVLVSQFSQEQSRSQTVQRQASREPPAVAGDNDVEMLGMSNFNNEDILESITTDVSIPRDTGTAADLTSGGPTISRLSSIASVDPDNEINTVEGVSGQPRGVASPDSAKPIKRIGSSSASLKRLGRSASVHPSSKSLERSDSYVQAGQGGSERRTSLSGQGGSERRTSLSKRRTSRSSLSRRLSIKSGGDETERTALLDGSDGKTDSVFSPQSPREVVFE